MTLQNNIRYLKNRVASDKRVLLFLLKVINTPVIGDVYDFFYFKLLKRKIRALPLEVTIEPNNICNLRCIMCPYKRMKRKRETMSMELFKKIVDQAKEVGCKDIHLTQYNEPFTDKLLFERLAYIRSKGMRSSFYSNGTILDKKIIDKILETPADLIRFSVDGVSKKTFESIRIGANYDKVVSSIQELYKEREKRKLKLPVIEVFFTILDKNKKECKQFLKYWYGKVDSASLYPADSRESKDFVGINYKKFKPYPCFNPKRVIVLSNGKVVLCCMDIDGEVVLGNLKKQTLKEIFESKKFKEIYQSQLERRCKIPMCVNCSKLYIDSALTGGSLSNFINF
mgnify:CR=1 FL=1